jgi:hypothetical protein
MYSLYRHYPNKWTNRSVVKSWIQCTRLGIDALQDVKRILAWATDLCTGESLPGVNFSITSKYEANKPSERDLFKAEFDELTLPNYKATTVLSDSKGLLVKN